MIPTSRQSWIERIWDTIIAISATAGALFIPLDLIFGLPVWERFLPVDIILSSVFTVDVFVRLRRVDAVHHVYHSEEVTSTATAKLLWTVSDILAAIPMFALFGPTPWQLLRLLKLARIARFMHLWRRRRVDAANFLRLAFFGYWLFLSVHWIACSWAALRESTTNYSGTARYVEALYWCVTTLTTVGYGDIAPVGVNQRMFAMCVMIVGVGIYGFIIGNVATMLANIDPTRTLHLQDMDRLTSFMRYRNLPSALQQRILEYHNYLWQKRLGYDESAILTSLPPSLRTEVSLFLKRDIIERVPLFQGASDEFIREIALQMRPVVYMPDDYVCRAGERGRDMYFISRGALEVISPDGRVLAILGEGDFFGEIALVLNQPRSASVRAREYCDLYRLDKEMFDRVLSHYPDIAAEIHTLAMARFQAESGVEDEQWTVKNDSE